VLTSGAELAVGEEREEVERLRSSLKLVIGSIRFGKI
jgi:hypothetical protein